VGRAPTKLCRGLPDALALFFSEELPRIAEAKRICAVCPAIVSCLEGAIQRREPCGVWGGQLFERGRIVHIKRPRGRPAKHPRPEDQVPDLPMPEHLVGYRLDRRPLMSA
jgi:WhiB family redox-sensing transcriptional regulator